MSNAARPRLVHYVEGRGPQAQAELRLLLRELLTWPQLLDAYLLRDPAQPELYLLESRWVSEVPLIHAPVACRSWRFEVLP